jgi:putative transcriptional regulator
MGNNDWKAAFGRTSGGAANPGLSGQLLIAMPNMDNPHFAGTVICVCAHSPGGAMGLILNKPIERLSFEALLKQVNVEPLPPARQIRLIAGGPVEESRGFVLHSGEWKAEGSLPVPGGWGLTANVDILKAIAGGGGPRRCVLALGYAGWEPGQLEAEIGQNVWLSVDADDDLLFDEDSATKWRRALAKLKVDPLLLSAAAGHA